MLDLEILSNLTGTTFRICQYLAVMLDLETLSKLETCQYLTGILELVHMAVIHTALDNTIRLVYLQLC